MRDVLLKKKKTLVTPLPPCSLSLEGQWPEQNESTDPSGSIIGQASNLSAMFCRSIFTALQSNSHTNATWNFDSWL